MDLPPRRMIYSPDILPVCYDAVRHQIRNGDVGLCRPTSFEGRAITAATAAKYSHAALFGWAGSVLMIGETREHHDARLIDARSEIAHWPGAYDVYRVIVRPGACSCPSCCMRHHGSHRRAYNGGAAWAFACRAGGSKYGWRHITRVFARRTLGLDVPAIPNSDDPRYPRDCSALVHAALRLSGGPRLKEYDADVVPGDLADLKVVTYLFTLFASQAQVDAFEATRRLNVDDTATILPFVGGKDP